MRARDSAVAKGVRPKESSNMARWVKEKIKRKVGGRSGAEGQSQDKQASLSLLPVWFPAQCR
jgi:hypothetical protein